MNESAALQTIHDLCAAQRLAVLATDMGGHPYANLVAFAASDDLRQLVFATTRATRKFANLSRNGGVALLIDNRSNSAADFQDAVAVTAIGTARELAAEERPPHQIRYLARHPSLAEFVAAPTCALFVIEVARYCLVSRFQNVVEVTFPS